MGTAARTRPVSAGKWLSTVAIGLAAVVLAGCGSSLDEDLPALVEGRGLAPLDAQVVVDDSTFDLGRALYFDPELSGNRNISCATCHHPDFASGDALSVSIGQGGIGLGTERVTADGGLIPRNAPDVYNRGASGWTKMFWDSRVSGNRVAGFETPAGDQFPTGVDNVLAAQAMFPVTSPGEMRGSPEDTDVFGEPNELAMYSEDDYSGIWRAIVDRLTAIPEYVDMFAAAYPDLAPEDIGFEHAANAIAAFEAKAFAFDDSPWNRYLSGGEDEMSDAAKRGALLFFGEAGCSTCHLGTLLTDQEHHSIAVPQVGPGKGEEAPEDWGRGRETSNVEDRYAFRTPPLHNVAVTGPWLHDGAFSSLEGVIRHHMDPEASLASYDVGSTVGPGLLFVDRQRYLEPLLSSISPELAVVPSLTDSQIDDLGAFLDALTDPGATDLSRLVPASVPSGLPVTGR
jgi:cytochrome c peroxidase